MSQNIVIDRQNLMNGFKMVALLTLVAVLVFASLILGDWLKQQWLSLKPPVIASIDTQKLLNDKAAKLKERMNNAQSDSEQQAILAELTQYGDTISQWVKQRAPALCGCLNLDSEEALKNIPPFERARNECHGRCIVLNQQTIIAGDTLDLTPMFLEDQNQLKQIRLFGYPSKALTQ